MGHDALRLAADRGAEGNAESLDLWNRFISKWGEVFDLLRRGSQFTLNLLGAAGGYFAAGDGEREGGSQADAGQVRETVARDWRSEAEGDAVLLLARFCFS